MMRMTTMALALILLYPLGTVAQNNSGEKTKNIGGTSSNPTKEPAAFEKAAAAINDLMVARYRDEKGIVNYAAAFNALGSLAGFGCQMGIREGFIKPGTMTENRAFAIVSTTDGRKYFFGDFLNACLLETGGQISVWSLVAGAAQKAGAKQLPEIHEIVAYNAKTLGTKDFGVPRVPEQYRSAEMPIDILKKDWPAMQKLMTDYHVRPTAWGWTLALAVQYLIQESKTAFDPELAAKITMEAATPMSKIDPATVGVNPN